MIWERMRFGKASLIGIATGMVAGLASITPAAGHVGPMGALIIGGVAGILCQELINVVKQNFSIDDSLDVFAVHGVGGIWGTLALPFLAATRSAVPDWPRASPRSRSLWCSSLA